MGTGIPSVSVVVSCEGYYGRGRNLGKPWLECTHVALSRVFARVVIRENAGHPLAYVLGPISGPVRASRRVCQTRPPQGLCALEVYRASGKPHRPRAFAPNGTGADFKAGIKQAQLIR
jgi:hypothetical protein